MRFIKPDFQNSIVNLSATLAEHLGCENDKPILPALAAELDRGYKNVVLLILDGLGMEPIRKNLSDDSFLRRHIRQTLTSVFPSTTTNATTSLLTDRYPMEHGWFGWSLYFEELGRTVNLFPETDSATGEPIEKGFVRRRLPVEPFYLRAAERFTASSVVPDFWDSSDKNKYVWHDFGELSEHVANLCRGGGEQFVYAYFTEPDSVMHRYGVSSEEARRTIGALNDGVEALFGELSDTLLIVTADHGQVDIGGCIELYRDEEIVSLLDRPLSLEARATAFGVKEGKEEEFCKRFLRKYGEDFALCKTEDLIRENYFGGGRATEHARFLGDYIAIARTDKIMKLGALGHDYKGHHASLTEEMLVPLIVAGKR